MKKNIQLFALVILFLQSLGLHSGDRPKHSYSQFSLLGCAKWVTGTTAFVAGTLAEKNRRDLIKLNHEVNRLYDIRTSILFFNFVQSANRKAHCIPAAENTMLNARKNAQEILDTTTDESIKERYYYLKDKEAPLNQELKTLQRNIALKDRRFRVTTATAIIASTSFGSFCLTGPAVNWLRQIGSPFKNYACEFLKNPPIIVPYNRLGLGQPVDLIPASIVSLLFFR